MHLIDGKPVFAATDLVGFLACDFLPGLELASLAGLVKRPIRADPELDLIRRRGFEHERRFLTSLEAQGRRVTRIEPDDAWETDHAERLRRSAVATQEAIRRGDDVIYQATFFDGRWRGHADFLLRVERPSGAGGTEVGQPPAGGPRAGGKGALGAAWSYEVADTKLARKTKASALIQICSYVEQLTRIQDVEPEWMHVALGGSARAVERFRVADYMAYYRQVKRRFEEAVARITSDGAAYPPPLPAYPEPVEHCEVCRWAMDCTARRRRDDDLSLVAGISARQRRGLKGRGIATRRALGGLELPLRPRLEGVSADALLRVREQARIQVQAEDAGRLLHELLEPARLEDGSFEPDRGLLSLPEPRPGDLFFDIEGDPFALEDGIDYLFGIVEPSPPGQRTGRNGEPDEGPDEAASTYHQIWSRDASGRVTREAEKRAFEETIDLIMDRLARDPSLHVYHYAPYETTAVARLMGRHATREEEVDRLLRGGVFVDLFRAVRQGVRASVESYSIKRLEPFYGFSREIDLRDAGSSIVAFEAWLEEGGEAGGDPQTLARIAGYNRDDCLSNWRLRDWLEARRRELEARQGVPLPRPLAEPAEPGEELSERLARVEALTDRLSDRVPADEADRTAEQHARWLLAQLLSWHRREAKAFWWRYYYLCDLTDEQLVEEREPIGALEYLGSDGPIGRGSQLHRFRFPSQEHDVDEGAELHDPRTKASTGSVPSIDDVKGILVIKRGPSLQEAPLPTSVIPHRFVGTDAQEESLYRIGEWTADHGIAGEGPYRAARELLLRRPPRVHPSPSGVFWPDLSDAPPVAGDGGALRRPDESALAAARRLVMELDESTLPIQGPPGAGKTYTGARMIVDLVEEGRRSGRPRRVGVTANSHKVIGNLLDAVVAAAAERGTTIRLGQKPGMSEDPTCRHATSYPDNEGLASALRSGEIDVAGATAWFWARPECGPGPAGAPAQTAGRARATPAQAAAPRDPILDLLVVDEAGQISLANAVAVAPAARSLVLLGDPQQLDQPLQGTHPPGAERSALAHLLGEQATMPAERGLFLERTWRLHPDLCAFTSEAFYEGRLAPEPGLERQGLDGVAPLAGTGIRFVPVAHQGNRNDSPEEAERVAAIARAIVEGGARWVDSVGISRPVGWRDVLVVAPYNAHVAEIARRLPAEARVGTVDKFQGQEAPISIYAMATSTPEDAPRGMDFLYSLNRLNVATSRARCCAAIVASPELIRVRCRTPKQMRLANGLCRAVEMGEG